MQGLPGKNTCWCAKLSGCDLHAPGGIYQCSGIFGNCIYKPACRVLKRYTDQVILTYDSDGAGVKAALRAIPILRDAGISARVLNMKPYKDPDEFIKNMGSEAFKERIAQAKNSFLFEIDVLKRNYQLETRSRRRDLSGNGKEAITVWRTFGTG